MLCIIFPEYFCCIAKICFMTLWRRGWWIRLVVIGDRVSGFVSGWVVSLLVFAWPVFAVVVSIRVRVARISSVSGGCIGGRVCGRVGVRVTRVSRVCVRVCGRNCSGISQNRYKKKLLKKCIYKYKIVYIVIILS